MGAPATGTSGLKGRFDEVGTGAGVEDEQPAIAIVKTIAKSTDARGTLMPSSVAWRSTEGICIEGREAGSGPGQRPAQPFAHAAAHDPLEVLALEPGQV